VQGRGNGVAYGIAAYGLWGVFPLYFPLLKPAGAIEILAHRIVWALVVLAGVLAVTRGWSRVRAMSRRTIGILVVAAALITVNWATYIYGVNNGHVVETSLGYFINPLITVVIGVVLLRERLRRWQWVAVGVSVVAVVVLTVDYGRPPWISLILAFSFGTYGLLKKQANTGAVESLSVETGVLFLPMLGYLLFLHGTGAGTFATEGVTHAALLVGAGMVTVVPLLFFGAAATRVPLTTMGLLQYLAPVLQFAVGVLVFGEDVPPVRWIGFGLVWLALAILTVETLATRRRVMQTASAQAAEDNAAAAAIRPAS
jgi:chloramphenicol-sensitive protein RarD